MDFVIKLFTSIMYLYKRDVKLAIQLGLLHHFLRKEMPVPSQEYDRCYPYV